MASYGSIEMSLDPIISSPSQSRSILLLAVAVLAAGFLLIGFGASVQTMHEITSSSLDATLKIPSDLGLSFEEYVNDKKQTYTNENNITNGCDSPFGYKKEERQRLVTCFGEENIVVASYDSNVKFAHQVVATVAEITGDRAHLLSGKRRWEDGFHFYVQAESGICEKHVPAPLCQLLECSATHPARVGDFLHEAATHPDQPTVAHFRFVHSPKCSEQYEGTCVDERVGGSGSGAGMQLYCTTHDRSTALLTVGGGGGGGAGPGMSFGNGGGAGMQILLANSTTACAEGGYDRHTDVKNVTCSEKRTVRGISAKGKRGSVKDDGRFVRNKACERREFVSGIDVVRAAVVACIQDPSSELSVSAGGGSGGGVNDNERLLYRFGTGFSFRFGPVPIDSSPNDIGVIPSETGDNTADFDFQTKCSYAYADAVCANAGYLERANTSYSLCSCPVVKMYSPPFYNYSCSYSSSKTSDEAVTVALLTQNCETWCPDQDAVTLNSGEACPVLLPACSCKVTSSNSPLPFRPSPSISPSALLSNASSAGASVSGTVQGDNVAEGEFPSLLPSMPPGSLPSSVPRSSAQNNAESTLSSRVPSVIPSTSSSSSPSSAQSNAPSTLPSSSPSVAPSTSPISTAQSNAPSTLPSIAPSVAPSTAPTSLPSSAKRNSPSILPSSAPSVAPSAIPTSSAQGSTPSRLPHHAPSAVPRTAAHRAPGAVPRTVTHLAPSAVPRMAAHHSPSSVPRTAAHRAPSAVPRTTAYHAPSAVPRMAAHRAPSSVPRRAAH